MIAHQLEALKCAMKCWLLVGKEDDRHLKGGRRGWGVEGVDVV